MDNKVIFRDRQEMQAADLNNLQDYAADAIKAVIADGLTEDRHFTGFAVDQTAATEISVAAGRLYSGGQLYSRDTATVFSLFTHLPVATKRIVSLVAWGQATEAQVEPRDFLVDLTSGATEPQAVAMLERQAVELNLVGGVESADPVAPAVPDNTVVIAYITMDTTGIAEVSFQTGNVLPSTKDNAAKLADLETWRTLLGPQIEAIETNITALEDKTDGKLDRSIFVSLAQEVSKVREALDIPDDYALAGADQFGDDTESDDAAPGYAAVVDEGVMFPFVASGQAALQLFNPLDQGVKRHSDDWLLPAYTEAVKLQIKGYSGDISMSQYQVQTTALKKYSVYRYGWRWRWDFGTRYWWFRYGTKFYTEKQMRAFGRHVYTKIPLTRYKMETATTSYNGVVIGQTFLTSASFWLTSVDMFLTQIAAAGDVQVIVCETDYGKPNLDKVLTSITVPRASLKKYPVATNVPLKPVWLEAGKRYAVMFITEGAHRMAKCSGNAYTQGTFFYGNDGEYFVGDLTMELMLNVRGAAFAAPRREVVLGNVSLAGGIVDLDIDTEAIVPDGTSLAYEVQVAGKWYPLADAPLMTSLPDILPLRAVMLGTRDAAPGIQLGANRITVGRPATAMTHVSTLRSLPGVETTSSVTVTFLLANFDSGEHTFVPRLKTAANALLANATAVTYSEAFVDEAGVVITRAVATFTLGAPVDEYKIEVVGTRTAGAAPYRIIERLDVAA